MTEETMIERCARATYECRRYGDEDSDTGIHTWETLPAGWKDAHRTMARAAIEEMRDPTAKMLEAGERHGIDSDCRMECDAGRAYRAMITAALQETSDEHD